MKFLTFFLIGRLSLEVWLALFPAEQIKRVELMAERFCEQQSCHKVLLDIQQQGNMIFFFAECVEVKL